VLFPRTEFCIAQITREPTSIMWKTVNEDGIDPPGHDEENKYALMGVT
jgi:hypothetical protein